MKINPLKILSFAAAKLSDDERVCRVCGEVFTVSAAEWNYNDYWNEQHESFNYELEFPDMDICDQCAIQETEDEYY